jgi:hypothetical protein
MKSYVNAIDNMMYQNPLFYGTDSYITFENGPEVIIAGRMRKTLALNTATTVLDANNIKYAKLTIRDYKSWHPTPPDWIGKDCMTIGFELRAKIPIPNTHSGKFELQPDSNDAEARYYLFARYFSADAILTVFNPKARLNMELVQFLFPKFTGNIENCRERVKKQLIKQQPTLKAFKKHILEYDEKVFLNSMRMLVERKSL